MDRFGALAMDPSAWKGEDIARPALGPVVRGWADEPERRRYLVRLWLTAHGARGRTARDVFEDYDGVPNAVEREPGMAGIVSMAIRRSQGCIHP